MRSDTFDISNLQEYRENNRMEVKKARGGLPSSLWDTYSAFANCYGGVIILGIAEQKDGTWRTTGLEDEYRLRKEFWDTINNRNKVSCNLLTDKDVSAYNEHGNIILVIHVPAASRQQRPVYINNDIWNGTFRRNWEGDYHCSHSEILAMLRDQPETTSDMKVLDDVPIDALNGESVEGYRIRHMAYKPGHPWIKLPTEKYLEQLGAAAVSHTDKKLHPTAAGLLMFGEEHQIVREFPEYFLDYREMLDPTIRWTDRVQSSSGEWTGNLFDFYFRVYNKLIKELKVPFRIEGGNRIDDTPVHKALREALANRLVNTDFYLPRSVVIRLEREKIIMENPGSIRTGKVQMLNGGISDPRNKTLMKLFNLINIGERAGSGVPDIFSVWKEVGWEEPTVEEQYSPDRTILILPLTPKVSIKSADKKAPIKSADKKAPIKKTLLQYQEILNYMQPGNEYRAADIAELLKLKDSRTKKLLRDLAEMGKITSEGSNRNRRYRLCTTDEENCRKGQIQH